MSPSRLSVILLAVLVPLGTLAAVAGGEVVQRGGVRVTLDGELTPKVLPRSRQVPVQVSVGTKIFPLKKSNPAKLRRISIAINSGGQFSPSLVPVCAIRDIQPSTTENALKTCRDSLVGTGQFSAKVLYPQQTAFPSGGKLYAFNGRYKGRPAILAHVYGVKPVPVSFTLPFLITKRRGQFGTVLTAALSEVTGKAGYITGLSMHLGRTVNGRGYVSASCPAPKGLNAAVFPLAKVSYEFGGKSLSSSLIRTCKVRR